MIKTYQLTTPARNNSFVLRGKTGNPMRYNFAGGDPITGKPASIILKGQYAQELLEESDLFKEGYVRLVSTTEGGETPIEKDTMSIESVTSPEQLIEFVAENLDKVYQRPDAALEYAKRKGYDFPNLVINK